MPTTITYLVCVVLGLVCGISFFRKKRKLPLPPGPTADPVVGHLWRFSFARQHELFRKWAAEYGDIFYLNVLHQSIVVINSLKVATDLLDKRGANYSDRPVCTTLELMGWTASLAFMRYGKQWKKHRRMFQSYFGPSKSLTYRERQTQKAHKFLRNLLRAPTDHKTVTQKFAIAGVIDIAYGHEVDSDDDTYIKLAQGAIHGVEEATVGASLLDTFPFLKFIPHWLPGCSSLTAAVRRWRPATMGLYRYSLEDVQKKMHAGIAQPSFLTSHLERLNAQGGSCEDIKEVTGAATTTLVAGADTTWSLLQNFFLFMLLFPEAQRKAQQEIDKVIGSERLPEFSDRDALPFVECVLQETIRWHPVSPLGVAHRSVDNDVYNGMFIPGGSLVVPNIMAMSRDEATYKDPEKFYPERFLPTPAGRNEPHLSCAFGFGRRVCPGRYFADNNAWIVIANVLAVFDICKSIGKDGKEIEPRAEFSTEGLSSHPRPFECVVRTRSKTAEKLILQQTE